MNTRILMTVLSLSALTVLAGDKSRPGKQKDNPGFNKAAERYDHNAKKLRKMAAETDDPATKQKMLDLADKNGSLAEHKRKASAQQKSGKGYNWDEYHKTQAEAETLWKEVQAEQKMARKDLHKEKAETKKSLHKEMKKKDAPSFKQKSEEKDAGAMSEKEKKPVSKTYKTESGFTVRTSL